MADESVPDQYQAFAENQAAEELENARWRPSYKNEDARDTADRKLYQAEMLAHSLSGEGFDAFKNRHDRIQEGVLWALADLITDAREALQESEK